MPGAARRPPEAADPVTPAPGDPNLTWLFMTIS